jgi:hypothetical protein
MSKLIFKIFEPSKTFHGVDYSEKKQKKQDAKLIHFENFGHLQNKSAISKAEFREYLTLYSDRNKRVKLPQFHAMLSCKGDDYTYEKLKDYTLEIMNRLGYEDNPMLIYEHSDTANRHVHIVTSRVNAKGKKINDSFEKKRANNILSEMLNLHPKEQFSRDLASSLLYRYSTEKQLLLLMELKGYKYKFNSQSKNYDFYKYGKLQGNLASSDIVKNLATNHSHSPLRGDKGGRMYSIIQYYKEKYSVEQLIDDDKKPYPGKKYQTALTNHLQKTFGWEFIFFKTAKHDQPYGYVIIDHPNRIVHKGNEIMKLHELLDIVKTPTTKATRPPAEVENKSIVQFDNISEAAAAAAAKPPIAAGIPLPVAIQTSENETIQENAPPEISMDFINELGNPEMAEANRLSRKIIKPKKAKKRWKY